MKGEHCSRFYYFCMMMMMMMMMTMMMMMMTMMMMTMMMMTMTMMMMIMMMIVTKCIYFQPEWYLFTHTTPRGVYTLCIFMGLAGVHSTLYRTAVKGFTVGPTDCLSHYDL